ncbi:hypothetical protein [Desulfosporosinus fructosivorans]|uniref:hypothetical protein n=1 Tax=Desulfosporosinus fructosivorans TaxID=2018669 RepID=UPI00130E7276|nr:hypothetical protein [Desulfosporosinus fructosivorans]
MKSESMGAVPLRMKHRNRPHTSGLEVETERQKIGLSTRPSAHLYGLIEDKLRSRNSQ